MSENNNQDFDEKQTDGGVATEAYLEKEINLFKPATPFMRDHLRIIWISFAAWVLVVFGPTTATWVAEEFMTETSILGGYPLHFFAGAIFTPLGALVLAAVYAWQRDRLDKKYNISHDPEAAEQAEASTATDGGESQ
ncbi:DUF4212 domain-containing protein [Salinarchaeum sp. IM2453]|uniref:DUF4212 domain-containing protein n=1 Tax=Salinarchaeum sp. IM2453 TaxID=2862870 RepID=UPI001C84079C|nr:DUF4212 domain-containing protein [Salinarchaeum sp. IM2453]